MQLVGHSAWVETLPAKGKMLDRWPLGERRSVVMVALTVIIVTSTVVLTIIRGAGSSWPILLFGGFYVAILVRYWLTRKDDHA